MQENKTDFKNYLLVFFMLLISSGSSPFISNIYAVFTVLVFIVLKFYWQVFNNKYLAKVYKLILFLIVLYLVGIFLQFGVLLDFFYLSRYVSSILIVSILYIGLNENFFVYLEKVIFFLVVVSLIFFSIQLISFSFLYNLTSTFFDLLPSEKSSYITERTFYSSILFYTTNEGSSAFVDQRNCGFVFEPGYFSFFINLGLLITLVLHNFRKKNRLIVYGLALISTFSTTGILGAILVMLFYFFNAKTSIRISLIPVFVATIVLFLNISFGYDKIESIISETGSVDDYELRAINYNTSMGRFAGFEYYFLVVLKKSPIFGVSLLEYHEQENISVANGLAHFIRNFGFLGFILMIIGMYNSIKIIVQKFFVLKYSFLIFLFLLLYLFAFPFSNLTIFWIFVIPFVIFPKNLNFPNNPMNRQKLY